MKKINKIIFLWDNVGPIHFDRLNAVAKSGDNNEYKIICYELFSKSSTYDWNSENGTLFEKITINKKTNTFNLLNAISLILKLISQRNSIFFFCHYERWYILTAAIIMRCLRRKVIVMNDSKFDDYRRVLWRELIKYLFYFPYNGALASGRRSFEYMQFLGFDRKKIKNGYNSMSRNRIVDNAYNNKYRKTVVWSEKHFTIIARLVEKKNLFHSLTVYKEYLSKARLPRKLKIAGSGNLERKLKEYSEELGLNGSVEFLGFIQTKEISVLLTNTLALLLLSKEEQFGNVVIEATTLGVPCVVSSQCGATDLLIQSGVNGFVVESDNIQGTAFFMDLLSVNTELWQQMSKACVDISNVCDTSSFVNAVNELIAENV